MLLRQAFQRAVRAAGFSTSASAQAGALGAAQIDLFDGSLKALHRDRAARMPLEPDPLVDEVTERLLDRLEDCRRTFPTAVVLGGAGAQVARRLAGGRAGVQELVMVDTSAAMLERARAAAAAATAASSLETGSSSASGGELPPPPPTTRYVHWDPASEVLPLEPGSADVVISCLGLHWINDVPGVMAQCRHALRPDGLFLAAMFGGHTLQELRIACTVAQQEREGGVSPRVSPLAQVRDAGNLLTRSGLAIPAVDVDDIQVHYRDAAHLVQHLRSMAESSGLVQRRQHLPRDVALAAAAAYQSLFGGGEEGAGAAAAGGDGGGGVPATFQVVYMTGWAPHASQQKPSQRGSATVSFEDLVASGLGGGDGGSGGSGGGDGGGGGDGSDGSASGSGVVR